MAKHRRNGDDSFQKGFDLLDTWYTGEVRQWAEEFDKRIKKGEFSDRDEFQERFDEETDGAAVVIYTAQSQAVVLVSRNDDAYAESFGEAPVKDNAIDWAAMALMAFRADIMERMESDTNDDDTFAEEDEDEDDDE